MPFSSLLDVPVTAVRAPGLRLLANGAELAGVIQAEVHSNSHYAADRFQATLALSATGIDWWSSQAGIFVDVQMSLDGDWQSMVQGAVDTVRIEPLMGTLNIEGRDLTAAFIEARTQETFANRTSSEIVQLLAARAGLSASVTATTTPVGRYYQLEHDAITLDQFSRATTQWDLMVFLAQRENFDIYVAGTTVFFQPRSQDETPPMLLMPQDVISLQLERSLTLARDIEVTVKSWNSRQRNAFTQTAHTKGGGRSQGGAGQGGRDQTQRYVYVRPNLTQDAALQFAQNMLAELSRHERVIVASMPGELDLTPRSTIQLSGTFSDFDQLYYVASIDRSISVERGFTQIVRARNMSVAADASPPAVDPPAQLQVS